MRKLVVPITLLASVSLSAQGPRPAPLAPQTTLPVTRVVLYKSGVAYFEHLASVTGNQSLAVQFTADQLDDVLKSLSALDLGDGRVVGINYDSPTPVGRRLAALTLPLGQDESALGVLRALRGTRIAVTTGGSVLTGRLLNVERRQTPAGQPAGDRDEMSLVTDGGEIVTLPITAATRVRIVDGSVRDEVNRYLGLTTQGGDRVPRRVVISTTGAGTRQVLVGYVGEAPVWKSTYRLIFPTAGGAPVLQGWAVVDNVSAADWSNVELSLVAGAPQAFQQPLSTPLFAMRPTVPVPPPATLAPQIHEGALVGGTATVLGRITDANGNVLPGATVTVRRGGTIVGSAVADALGRYQVQGVPPGTYDVQMQLPGFQTVMVRQLRLAAGAQSTQNAQLRVGALEETITVAGSAPAAQRVGGNVAGVTGGIVGGLDAAPPPPPPPAPAYVEQRATNMPVDASASDMGDLFEYRLRDRVTIARNQSSLVPILQARVAAERVSLWNASMGLRPRRAVWLTNTSDLTLDAGSLSVVDAGAFAGEGLVDVTKPGERRLLSFAADLSVAVSARDVPRPSRVVAIRIARGVLTRTVDERRERTYTIRNNDREARAVILEHPIASGWTVAEGVVPEESTVTVHRIRVSAPPGQTQTLSVEESRRMGVTYQVGALTRETLLTITDTSDQRGWLEPVLAPLFEKNGEVLRVGAEIDTREAEVRTISEDQTRVRQNMGALKGTSEERRLNARYVKQLDEQETRLVVLKAELASLRDDQQRLQQELAELITRLSIEQTF